jgi:hypothetical protein
MVLAIGIGLLSAVGWMVNGVLTASSSAGQANPPSAAGPVRAHTHKHRAAPAPSPSPRPSPAPTRRAPAQRDPARHRNTSGAASGTAAACAPGTVTLLLSSPQYWYQAGKTPRFIVRAVTTGSQPCRFNMGTRFVAVVVAADKPIWSSADCPQGRPSHPFVLTASSPAVLRVSWNEKTSSPGCGTEQAARPGEYQATAVDGRLRSKAVNIVLGARGASGP